MLSMNGGTFGDWGCIDVDDDDDDDDDDLDYWQYLFIYLVTFYCVYC